MKYFHPSGFFFISTDLHRLYFTGDVTAWFSRVLHALSPIYISRTKRDRYRDRSIVGGRAS